MKKILLEISKISKKYGDHEVLSNVTFNLNNGEICGLVGENGAGKTTLIRILSKTIIQDSGKIVGRDLVKISSIIESPSLYPNLSAYNNLKYHALWCGVKNIEIEIKKILSIVGLSDVDGQKKVKDYSLGMKQRLALGLMMIDTPDLLILDEPINGLDPSGIKDIRDILLTLKERYRITILISSHILAELELIADNYVIISKGRVLQTISKEELLLKLQNRIILNTENPCLSASILKRSGYHFCVEDSTIKINTTNSEVTNIIDLLRQQNVLIHDIYQKKTSFEEYYLSLIN